MFNFKFKASTLEKEIYVSAVKLNGIIMPFLMFYLFCYADISFENMGKAFLFGILCTFGIMLSIIPFTNKLLTGNASSKIENWKSVPTDIHERTELVRLIYKMPARISGEVFLAVLVGCIAFIAISKGFGWCNLTSSIYSYFGSVYVSAVAYIFTWEIVHEICMYYAKPIVLQGIEASDESGYGTSLKSNFFLFIIFPIILVFISNAFILYGGYLSSENRVMHIFYTSNFDKCFKSGVIMIVNLLILLLAGYIFYSGIKRQVKESRNGIKLISKSNVDSSFYIDCAFANELDYNVFLTNEAVLMFRDLINRMKSITVAVEDSSQNLLKLWNQSISTYDEHSAAITYVINSIEIINELSKSITQSVQKITDMTEENFHTVDEGVTIIDKNIKNMHDIQETNNNTIFVMKTLNEKIDNIGSIVKTIDGIADQTKIIALNAELEAVNAGESGRNFGIVANEIRRLADDTMSAITEIKNSIDEVQKYSDKLIVSSEDGTEKISDGMTLSYELEEKFKKIYSSAGVTASSSSEMQENIYRENEFFASINKTIESLSHTLEVFVQQSKTLTDSCASLASISSQLSVVTQE